MKKVWAKLFSQLWIKDSPISLGNCDDHPHGRCTSWEEWSPTLGCQPCRKDKLLVLATLDFSAKFQGTLKKQKKETTMGVVGAKDTIGDKDIQVNTHTLPDGLIT